MSNIDDARVLISALRELGDPGAGLMAHTIEAGLDEALGVILPENEVLISLSRQERDDLIVSLTKSVSTTDGALHIWDRWNALLFRLHTVEFPEPAFPGEAHWRDDEHTGPLEAPAEPASETES